MSTLIRRSLALSIAVMLCSQAAWARDADAAAQRLLAALDRQDRWLGDGQNGDNWRDWLRNNELRAQIAAGAAADMEVVGQILDLYRGVHHGLRHRRFGAVRRALDRWLAQLPAAGFEELPNLARAADDQYNAPRPDQLTTTFQGVARSSAELDEYLTPGGDNGTAWKQYLLWEQLQAQLGASAEEARLDVLDQVRVRIRDYYEGLELPIFQDLALAIDDYINARLAAFGEDPRGDFQARLAALGDALQRLGDEPAGDTLEEVARHVEWLERRRHADRLLHRLRRHFRNPNLWVYVSEGVIADALATDVDEREPVRDMILGTSISGTGHTTGVVRVDLVESPDEALLHAVFVGQTRTRTVGINGPAQIDSVGRVDFRAVKKLVLDEHGLRAWPTDASADTRTTTLGVSSRRCLGRRLIQRIASRRVAESKRTGEIIGSRHAEERIGDRMDTRVGELLEGDDEGLLDTYRDPLIRRGAYPERIDFSTTDDSLEVHWLQTVAGLASPTPHPPLAGNPDIAFRVHESMVNNFAADMLGGYHLTEQDLQTALVEMLGELPERFQAEEGKEPWSITFDRFRPITVRFGANRLGLIVRGSRFTSGDKEYARPMNISVEYAIEPAENGVRLVRQDDVVVLPPGFRKGQRLGIQDTTLRNLLIRRFNRMLDAEFVVNVIELPEEYQHLGQLVVDELKSDIGWLATAWMLEPATADATTTASLSGTGEAEPALSSQVARSARTADR